MVTKLDGTVPTPAAISKAASEFGTEFGTEKKDWISRRHRSGFFQSGMVRRVFQGLLQTALQEPVSRIICRSSLSLLLLGLVGLLSLSGARVSSARRVLHRLGLVPPGFLAARS